MQGESVEFNFNDAVEKIHELILLINFFCEWKFDPFMDIQMLAPRSDKAAELTAITVLVAHYSVLLVCYVKCIYSCHTLVRFLSVANAAIWTLFNFDQNWKDKN